MTSRTIVVVSAGVGEPSSTRLLADRLAQRTLDLLGAKEIAATVSTVELRDIVAEIGEAIVTGVAGTELRGAVERLAQADAVVAATPVYKAGMSGLFKAFIDLIDDDLLIAKPVALVATAGSARHSLVPDEQMRPLFAYLRTLPTPTSLFAATEDWADSALTERINRTAAELAALVAADITGSVVDAAWDGYRHEFGSSARPSGKASPTTAGAINLDTDLMRIAAGGLTTP
jgi:FMN reductase